jgi:hypothetical protein
MLFNFFANPGTGRGLSRDLWKQLPQELFYSQSMIHNGIFDFDDFRKLSTGDHTVTQATSGTFALKTGGVRGGVVVADSGATTDNQGPNIQRHPYVSWALGDILIFEARITPTANTTAGNIFLGLAITDTTCVATDAMAVDDYIGFRALGTANITLCSKKDNGTEQASSSAVGTLASGTAIRLGFVVDKDGAVTPYVNGAALTTASTYKLAYSSSARPTDVMGNTLVVQSNGTTQPTVEMDYWAVGLLKSEAL